MKIFLYVLLAFLALGMLEARYGFGAEIELQTAGSTYADPSPYYKGGN